MNMFAVAMCWGFAANSVCNTMTDKPVLLDSLSDCLPEAELLEERLAQGEEHFECLRYDGRQINRYDEVTKR